MAKSILKNVRISLHCCVDTQVKQQKCSSLIVYSSRKDFIEVSSYSQFRRTGGKPKMNSTPPSEETKTNSTPPSDFGWSLNQTLNQLLGFYDTKAAALIAADVVIFALLLQSKPTFSSHSEVLFKSIAEFLIVLFPFTYGLALLSLVVSAGFALYAFSPPTFRENENNPVLTRPTRHLSW